MAAREREIQVRVDERIGEVAALLRRPRGAHALLLLAHGAGAGMRHPFLEGAAARLADHGVATLRYQFPYMQRGKRAPDPRPVLVATVRAAVIAGRQLARGLPLLAGGKSMGGRMTSMCGAEGGLRDVRGLVFFGFPLHAAGKPSQDRAKHLVDVALPMLFLQGTRDRLADLAEVERVCARLGERATLHAVEDGDHSFHVPKRSGRSDDEVLDELAARVAEWAAALPGPQRS